jgi:hypothetical protein
LHFFERTDNNLIIAGSPFLYEKVYTRKRFLISLFGGGFFSKSVFKSMNLLESSLLSRFKNRKSTSFSIFIFSIIRMIKSNSILTCVYLVWAHL